ncbi:hypothetical protein L6164_016957 [Bauhinia variegata]|uniref:Uncharacterized protein n=1 Tax=Bauhinia variegata TaxID=167791 RepID=A0ACB9N8B6_BAUVA|nr:hypothetical protein L6164_016957 [Bauhinia variegata]
MARIKKPTGRRKIEIKKMSKESNLQVTFSKRRGGIFKKASELCTLCAAEVVIIIFSPGNKAFSFGHSSVNDVINRLLAGTPSQTSGAMQAIEAHRNANVLNLNAQLTQVSDLLDTEKKLSRDLNKLLKPTQEQFWWAGPIEEMSKPQLELLKSAMKELQTTINLQANMMQIQRSDPVQFSASSSSGPVALQPTPQSLIQPPIVQGNCMFDGNMMPLPPTIHGFSNMGGFGPGFSEYAKMNF